MSAQWSLNKYIIEPFVKWAKENDDFDFWESVITKHPRDRNTHRTSYTDEYGYPIFVTEYGYYNDNWLRVTEYDYGDYHKNGEETENSTTYLLFHDEEVAGDFGVFSEHLEIPETYKHTEHDGMNYGEFKYEKEFAEEEFAEHASRIWSDLRFHCSNRKDIIDEIKEEMEEEDSSE